MGRKLRGESGQQVSTCAAGFWVAASSLTGQVRWGLRLSVGAWVAASKQRLGPSDCSKCWFGVIRRHIIRRRQARGSGPLLALSLGPWTPLSSWKSRGQSSPSVWRSAAAQPLPAGSGHPAGASHRVGLRPGVGGALLCGQPASYSPSLPQRSGPTLGTRGALGLDEAAGLASRPWDSGSAVGELHDEQRREPWRDGLMWEQGLGRGQGHVSPRWRRHQ